MTTDNTVSPAKTTTTLHLGGAVYENDVLQFISHEEGRIRYRPAEDTTPASFQWDYFVKDHLGNVRMVITEELKTDKYEQLTFEDANKTLQNAQWENKSGQSINVDAVRSSVNFGGTTTNAMLVRKSTGSIGATKLLKVMSGDRIHTQVDYFYNTLNATTNSHTSTLPTIVNSLVSSITASTAPTSLVKGEESVISSELQSNTDLSSAVNTAAATNPNNSAQVAPRAYLCVLFFNEQFEYDKDNSKVFPIAYQPGTKGSISKLGADALTARRNGYVYVYFTNESDELVYFDNFMLSHERGPILEETHYYPFGLTMAGISSKAAGSLENKRKWNKGSELESKEFSDGSGLELYSTFYRSLDPQLGRFWQIDPKPDYAQSLYASMGNNPILYNDPLGDTARVHFRTGFLGLGKRHAVDYNNGTLTNTDGTVYTGKVKGFLKKAVTGLDKLRTGGENGNKLVTEIQNSTETVNIIKGNNGFTANDKETGMKNVVRWSPGTTLGGLDERNSTSRPSFIGLGHELAHAFEKVFLGRNNFNEWYTSPSQGRVIPKAEIFATHVENLIRTENNISLRINYGTSIEYDPGTGTPLGEIIVPGTRVNPHIFNFASPFTIPYHAYQY